MMGLLLSLIVAVAAFNIITSLGLLVMEKQGEVAILQTQGLTRRQIMSVFMVQAPAPASSVLLGTARVLLATNLNNLMPILGALIDGASLPVAVDPLQVTIIAVVAMAVSCCPRFILHGALPPYNPLRLYVMSNHLLLQCDNLCKTYQEGNLHTDVLRNVSFAMQQGEMMAIVGSSGSGKSTLLHLLGGLDSPTSGEVIFRRIAERHVFGGKAELRNRQLGFIYQFHHLLPDFTALENAAMPLLIGGAKQAQEKAREMLAAVGWKNAASTARQSSPAASVSAWQSRARWLTTRRWCWRTNRPVTWTNAPRTASSICWAS